MATNRILQLLRSTKTYASFDAAKDAVQALTGHKDGEILLARYGTGTPTGEGQSATGTEPFYTAIGVYDAGHTKWTVFKSSDEIQATITALQNELDATQTGAGLGNDGSYTAPVSGENGYEILGGTGAPDDLREAIMKVADYVYDTIQAMDYSLNVSGAQDSLTTLTTGDASKVVTAANQTDGKIAAGTTAAKDLLLTGYANNSNSGDIAATDTLEGALSKLENNIAANDTARTVVSSDQSITVGTVASGTDAGKTDVIVNVDGATIVKDASSHVIKTNLKIAQVVTGTPDTDEFAGTLGNNVKEAYVLTDGTTSYGKQINIYKDSALQSVKLLHADLDANPQLKPTYSNGTWTDIDSASQTEENLALCYAYLDVNGDTIVEAVPVGDFLRESEFGDGLQVNSGIVSVRKDTTSGKVRIADGDAGLVDVLTVSSNGVKVDNIQGAINYAVQNASTSLAVTAEGDDYVSASVDANTDNKHVVVETNVQDLTATAGTAGVYNSTTGAQTTAPTHGTLIGVADSLADSSDIATKVKTYVDGEIAIEAARADAQVQTEENRATTAENNIDTAVGITNHAYTAPSGTNYLGSTTSVMNALSALDTAAGNGLDQVNGSDAIDVTTKANKAQTISLILDETTQGNGNENTGTDNALTITDNGLFLSTTWDCGVY